MQRGGGPDLLPGVAQLLGLVLLFVVATVTWGIWGFLGMLGLALYLLGQELPPRDPRT